MMNETKRKIICAWVSLLAKHALEEIHMDDILGIAEVSRDTYYYYFDGITNMPVEILESETDAILEKLDLAEDKEEALHELISFLKNRRVMLMRIYKSVHRSHAEMLADTVAMKTARILLAEKGERGSYKSFVCRMLADGISGCIKDYMAGKTDAMLLTDDFSDMLLSYAEHVL